MLNLQILLLAVTVVATVTVDNSDWTVFKAKYGKIYKSQDEDRQRRNIYEDNMKKIHDHNILFAKGLKSFYLGENQFTDMTNTEFNKLMNRFNPDGLDQLSEEGGGFLRSNNVSLPSAVNWVEKGYVTSVKDQGQCGSCWAFSATGSLEGVHAKQSGILVSLSEQNLIDCSAFHDGCDGGLMIDAFSYIIRNKGIDTEMSYPYEDKQGPCRFKRKDVGALMKSYVRIKQGSEKRLRRATAKAGPISVAIDASHYSFQLYAGGVYDEPECSSTKVTHAVLVVGYGSEHGVDYWLVKNSWDTTWGTKGYISMSRNANNQCGIATLASYPVI